MQTVERELDAFQYFEGGRDGVKRRFGDRIKTALYETSASDLSIYGFSQATMNSLFGIHNGNYELVNKDLVDETCDGLGYCFNEGFGKLKIDELDKAALLEKMTQDGFVSSNPQSHEDENIYLYLLQKALPRL